MLDWFAAALVPHTCVSQALGSVASLQELRLSLVNELRQKLCPDPLSATDRLTELRQRLFELKQTLDLRLPLLSTERRGAWFRPYHASGLSAFSAKVLIEPIFAAYKPEDAPALRIALRRSYQARCLDPLAFASKESPCLWGELLRLNYALADMSKFGPPLAPLRLDQLPEALPPGLASAALQHFFKQLKHSLAAAEVELQGCFQKLWLASEEFWKSEKPPAPEPERSQAETLRGDFRARRQSLPPRPLLAADLQALALMQLSTLPTAAELRGRYLQMARRHHPDRPEGDEEAFKALAKAYAHLAAIAKK